MTSLNDYLKVVWAALAQPHCPHCGDELVSWSQEKLTQKIASEVEQNPDETHLLGFTVYVSEKKKARRDEIDRLVLLGFSRFFDPASREVSLLEERIMPFRPYKYCP